MVNLELSDEDVRNYSLTIKSLINCFELSNTRSEKLQNFHCVATYIQDNNILVHKKFHRLKTVVEEKLRYFYEKCERPKWIPQMYFELFNIPFPSETGPGSEEKLPTTCSNGP